MVDFAKTVRIACVAMLGMTSMVYAQQPGQSDMFKMPGMSGGQMQGMGGMHGQGMNMQGMMKHCVQMHRKMSEGKPMSSKMHKMMAQCEQMDHGMKMDAPAPDATKER